MLGLGGLMTLSLGVNRPAGVPGPYPAPSGYRWDFVVERNVPATETNQRVVELKRIAA